MQHVDSEVLVFCVTLKRVRRSSRNALLAGIATSDFERTGQICRLNVKDSCIRRLCNCVSTEGRNI